MSEAGGQFTGWGLPGECQAVRLSLSLSPSHHSFNTFVKPESKFQVLSPQAQSHLSLLITHLSNLKEDPEIGDM